MTPETKKVLLCSFKLRDKYKLERFEIWWRALDCAERRAELYGWKDVEVKLNRTNEFPLSTLYEFEIWGYEQNSEKVVDN